MAKKKIEWLVADKPIIFGLVDGPGHTLDAGGRIEVSRVNPGYVETIRKGETVREGVLRGHIVSEDAPDSDDDSEDDGNDQFDPVGKSVADVLEYLKTASDDEVARVKEAEASNTTRPSGPSKSVADFEKGGE